MLFLDHQFKYLVGHIHTHVVVESSACKNDLGIVAYLLGFVRQIVGVHTDAVTSHKPRPERKEVPLRTGRFKYGFRVNAELVENDGQFIDERDVDVSLGILDDLGRFRHPDAWCQMCPGCNNRGIKPVYSFSCLRGGTGSDFQYPGHCVFFVSRVDTLRGVTAEKIFIELQSGELFEYRHTLFFGGTGIYC